MLTFVQDSTIASGALPLALVVALAAGFVSFASPCVLPLVPGFLGYVTGLSDVALEQRRRSRLVLGALLFVLGFAVVFVAFTLIASALSYSLRAHLDLLTRVGGAVVIALAFVFLGVGSRVGLQRTVPVRWRAPAGLVGAPLLGAVFALSWAPCIGPTLGAILALTGPLSVTEGASARAVVLGVAYSLGLGIPFVLIAAGYSRASRTSTWLRRHQRAIHLFGGGLLLLLGVLMVSGVWVNLMTWTQAHLVGTFTTVL
ncbi:MAG: cytochrome c biogenesis protein CcdA [Lapillicoccus sp.]